MQKAELDGITTQEAQPLFPYHPAMLGFPPNVWMIGFGWGTYSSVHENSDYGQGDEDEDKEPSP